MAKKIKKATAVPAAAPDPATVTKGPADPVGQAAVDDSSKGMEATAGNQEVVATTGEPVAPVEAQGQPSKPKIPKRNSEADPATSTTRARLPKAVQNTDIGEEVDIAGSDITLGRMVNPEEAVGYAMTQDNPITAVRQLQTRRQLSDTTATYALMEEHGYVMGV